MDLVKKQFAVLGANGYLGRHLAAHLQSAGHAVTAYDLPSAAAPDGICRRPLDITNSAAFDSVDTNVDALFMFAGLTGTHQGFDEYARYLAVNELGLLHLLDLLRRRGHRPRIVFPSSRLVYRGRPEPLPEDGSLRTIAAALNGDRVPTRSGARWNPTTVSAIVERAKDETAGRATR